MGKYLSACVLAAAMLSIATVALAAGEQAGAMAGSITSQKNTNTSTNLGYLFAVYIVTWAGFFAYLFLVSRRQKEIEKELSRLRERLGEESSSPAKRT
ncbi:MAG: CcmD family protein [SAR202 cluster bacterium]|nr:CcmD family protein [SAR202 cluster bacterium]